MKKILFTLGLGVLALAGTVNANWVGMYHTYRSFYTPQTSQVRILRAGVLSDQDEIKPIAPNVSVISEVQTGDQLRFAMDPAFFESRNLIVAKWNYNSEGLMCEEFETASLDCTVTDADVVSDVWVQFTVKEYVINNLFEIRSYNSNVMNVTKDWIIQ